MKNKNKTNIIWIDPNIDDEENEPYIKEIESIKNINFRKFDNEKAGIFWIKKIRFEETTIIIDGSLYKEFIRIFKENLNRIYTIPKIIIFTKDINEFLENNSDYNTEESFYNLGGIQTSFDEIKKFILNPIKKRELQNDELTFEYIDNKNKLILPLFYKTLIELTPSDKIEQYSEYIYDKYSSTNEEIKELFKSIKSIPKIPMQLLSKYYARLYTIESDFYNDINKDLRENKKENYLSYIKVLYEGVKLKSLPLASDNILYRGSKISNKEIQLIKTYLKNKKKDLPGVIVFSKSFLSFSKDKNIAKSFLKNLNKDNNLSKVLYIIEKDDKLDYSLSTHTDIENISTFPNEKEVLFFPFSSFEIKKINEKWYNNEKIYEIDLLYLGKYLKEIENTEENNCEDLPNTQFKKDIIKLGLIPENKIKNSKEVINHYKIYKNNINNVGSKNFTNNNINNINNKSNEITIIYNIDDKMDSFRIFGRQFVENNKDKCKIVFENK